MSTEFKFAKDGWIQTHAQREWVPNWLYRIYAKICPPWLQPFRWILNRKIEGGK